MFPEVPFHLDILSTNLRIANGSMQISMEKNICGKQYIVRCVVNGSRRKTFKGILVKQKRYSVDQPPSWWPAVCLTISTTTRSQVLAARSLLLQAKTEAPPLNQPLLDQPDYFILSHVFLVAATCNQLFLKLF